MPCPAPTTGLPMLGCCGTVGPCGALVKLEAYVGIRCDWASGSFEQIVPWVAANMPPLERGFRIDIRARALATGVEIQSQTRTPLSPAVCATGWGANHMACMGQNPEYVQQQKLIASCAVPVCIFEGVPMEFSNQCVNTTVPWPGTRIIYGPGEFQLEPFGNPVRHPTRSGYSLGNLAEIITAGACNG